MERAHHHVGRGSYYPVIILVHPRPMSHAILPIEMDQPEVARHFEAQSLQPLFHLAMKSDNRVGFIR